MPAEAKRLQRRITGRDRSFLVVLAAAALVGTPSAVLLSQHRSTPSPDAHCVTMIRAFIMGGATFKYCGADAVVACRQAPTTDKGLAAQCERIGLVRRP